MGFFSNRTVNYLNIHLALVNLLEQSYWVFGPVFLYKQGFSVAAIFAFFALTNMLRIPFRFLSFPLVRRFGIKAGTMTGAIGFGLAYPLLGMVKGYDGWLLLYMVTFSLFSAIHWHCYHTFYSLAGEHEKRGRQIAAAYALSTGLCAAAPLLSGFLIVQIGFQRYFMLPFLLMILMLATLSRCHNIPVPSLSWREGRKYFFNLGVRIHLAESAAAYPLMLGWVFSVYFYVKDIVSLGGIITFGVFVQMLYQLFLGALMDKGKGTLIVSTAAGLRVTEALGKALLPLSLPMVFGLEALSATGSVHHTASQPMVMYNAGKESPHPFWYWLFAEAAWDVGTMLGAGTASLLLWQGVKLQHVILIAIPAIVTVWWLIYRYFRGQAYARSPA